MNLPPVFTILSGDTNVTDIIGVNPTRCYLFAAAPQNTQQPFVTWHVSTSTPENHLDRLPVVDQDRVQVDCWATSPTVCIQLAGAVRDALELHTHMITKLNMGKDPDTNLHRWVLEFTFWTGRN